MNHDETALINITDGSTEESNQINYSKISLDADDISVGNYQNFLRTLRNYLKSGDKSHCIDLLRKPSQFDKTNKFLEVELFYKEKVLDRKISITLALYVLNAYVIAYKSEKHSFFFKELPPEAKTLLFVGTTKKDVPVATNYGDLPDRSNISLSKGELQKAIQILHDYDGGDFLDDCKKKLVVIIEMIAEAARFKLIQDYIGLNLINGYTPKADTISYENAWDPLSKQIQLSDSHGNFKTQVQVQDEKGNIIYIKKVGDVESNIRILLYKGPAGETLREEEIGEISDEQVVED